jgi:hypothetical protein
MIARQLMARETHSPFQRTTLPSSVKIHQHVTHPDESRYDVRL